MKRNDWCSNTRSKQLRRAARAAQTTTTNRARSAEETMTDEQLRTIKAAIEEAERALPHGDDRQLKEWVLNHPSLTQDIHDALFDAGLNEIIREERARALGVALEE
jgi:hypothetical protein